MLELPVRRCSHGRCEVQLKRGQLEHHMHVLKTRLGSVVKAHNISVEGIDQRRDCMKQMRTSVRF